MAGPVKNRDWSKRGKGMTPADARREAKLRAAWQPARPKPSPRTGRTDPWGPGGTVGRAMQNADRARAGLRKAGWGK